jgi:glycosyltransferase involved in cell wall biosynthesis
MADKIKLGIIADAGVETGFSRVTHSLAYQLQNSGEFEVQIIGINYDGRPSKYSKDLTIWPARLGGDLLGVGLIPEFLETFKPDVFFMFQDFWHITSYVAQCPNDMTGLVSYYPVDSPNIKGQFMLPLACTAQNVCYTNFGVSESTRAAKESWERVKTEAAVNKINVVDKFSITVTIPGAMGGMGRQKQLLVSAYQLKQLTRPEAYKVIPHGIDLTAFYKLPSKYTARKQLGMPVKGFYVGYVARNQSRKRQDLAIRAFAKFAATHPESRLVFMCTMQDAQGWDLDQLAEYYGIKDKVIAAHNLFDKGVATIEQLNLLYNTFDVHINTGGGEGWGLPNFESAAAGVTQIVPDWSATKEIWENSGLLIKIAAVRHEPMLINTMQAVIDVDHLAEILSELYENPSKLEELGKKCYDVTQRPQYQWPVVANQFAEVFRDAIGKTIPNAPMALNSQGVIELKKIASGQAKLAAPEVR